MYERRWHKAINVAAALALAAMLVVALILALFPMPALAAEVTIHDTLLKAPVEYGPSPNVVFISDQVGYAFFIAKTGPPWSCHVAYSKTTDGGASWEGAVAVALSGVMGTDKDWVKVAVWYDQWTPGGSGTKIHIVATEVKTDDIWYNWLDTSDDSMRTDAIVVMYWGSVQDNREGAPSITKSTDGKLFILGFGDDTGAVYKSTDGGDSWPEDTGIPTTDVGEYDLGQLLPLSGGDVLLIFQDVSADKFRSKVYDEEDDSWGSWADIDTWGDSTSYRCNWGASLFKSTGDIYLAGNTWPDGGTSYPLKAYKFTESTRTWSTLTNIAAVAEALQVTMAVDQNNGDLYAIYIRGPNAGSDTDVYYKKSTDGGSTWGTESSALNTSTVDYRYVRTNFTSNERIYTVWYDHDDHDLLGDTVADITPPVGQTWYLSGGGGYVMYKGDTSKTAGTVTVTDDGSETWIADEATTIDVGYPADTWTGHITFDAGSTDTTVRVYVGKWDGSIFTPSAADEYADVSGSSDFSFSASAFTVPQDEWLACKIEDYADGDSDSVIVSVGGNNSYLTSPSSDPGYPIPELPTIILIGAGLACLGGYIAFMRRKRRVASP